MTPTEHPTPTNELLVADCLDVLQRLPNQSVDAVITDPPYPNGQGLFTTQLIDGLIGLYLATKKVKNYVVFFWSPNHDPPRPPLGWWHTATHIWHKIDAKSITPYEHIIVWSRTYKRLQSKVWTIPILDYRTLRDFGTHPTQKPVRLLRNLIELYTKEGDLVLDPFAGTGTTAVACQYAKRRFLIVETNPEYAAFARQRLEKRERSTEPTPTDRDVQDEVQASEPFETMQQERPKKRR